MDEGKAVYFLKNLPVPPSENNLYKTVQRGSKVWRAPSQALREFKLASEAWAWKNVSSLRDAQKLAKEGQPLQVDLMLRVKPSRIWTKLGTVKRFDGHNRIKASCDALAEMLLCDDSLFFSVSIIKAPDENEGLDILIRPFH